MSVKRPTYNGLGGNDLGSRKLSSKVLGRGSSRTQRSLATGNLRFSCILFLFFTILLTVSFGARNTACAKELSADEVRVSTPVYFPSDRHSFREGIFRYEVSWQGIHAADVEITVSKKDEMYEVFVSVETNSFVDVFYKLRYTALGAIAADDFSPGFLLIDQRENSRVTKASLAFSDDGRIRSELSKKKDSGNRFREYDFHPNNFTLEPLSAAFLARSLDWAPGVERQFDTFDGKSRYLISLKCTDERWMKVGGTKRRVWVVEPTVLNLNRQEKAKKLRRAALYVTADEHRDILQITSEVFIGSVKTQLTAFEPALEKPLQVVARRTSQERS